MIFGPFWAFLGEEYSGAIASVWRNVLCRKASLLAAGCAVMSPFCWWRAQKWRELFSSMNAASGMSNLSWGYPDWCLDIRLTPGTRPHLPVSTSYHHQCPPGRSKLSKRCSGAAALNRAWYGPEWGRQCRNPMPKHARYIPVKHYSNFQ